MTSHDDAPFDADPPKMTRPGKATGSAPAPKAAMAKSSTTASEAQALVELVTDKPLEVLLSEEGRTALYKKIRIEIVEFKPDLTTQAGRDRIKSLAYKIVRTRTTLDNAGKEANATLRDQINGVDKIRRDMTAALATLEEEARAPLVAWEKEQAKLADQRRDILEMLATAVHEAARPGITVAYAGDFLEGVRNLVIDPDLWGDDLDMISQKQADAVALLQSTLDAAETRDRMAAVEAENAELRRQMAAKDPAPDADPDPPGADPVYQQRETPPTGTMRAPLAAGSAAPVLTPTQQARRLVLPVLAAMGVDEETAKVLILAIERGELPGITATYLEN